MEAEEIIESIDKWDIPFITAYFSTACDGICSDDKDLKRQVRVKVWSTRMIIHLI
jgi:predicted nucleic acid-binding protein